MKFENGLLLFFEPGWGEKLIGWKANDTCKLVDLLPRDVGFGCHGDVECFGPCQVVFVCVVGRVSTLGQRDYVQYEQLQSGTSVVGSSGLL